MFLLHLRELSLPYYTVFTLKNEKKGEKKLELKKNIAVDTNESLGRQVHLS